MNYIISSILDRDESRCPHSAVSLPFETEEEATNAAINYAQKNPGSKVGIYRLFKKIVPPQPIIEVVQ